MRTFHIGMDAEPVGIEERSGQGHLRKMSTESVQKKPSKAQRPKMTRGSSRKLLVQNLPLGVGKGAGEEEEVISGGEISKEVPHGNMLAPGQQSSAKKKTPPKEHKADQRPKMTRGTSRKFLVQNLPLGIGKPQSEEADSAIADSSSEKILKTKMWKEHSKEVRPKMTRGSSRKFLVQNLPLGIGKKQSEEGNGVQNQSESPPLKPKTPKEHSKAQRPKVTRGTSRKLLVQNLPLGVGKSQSVPEMSSEHAQNQSPHSAASAPPRLIKVGYVCQPAEKRGDEEPRRLSSAPSGLPGPPLQLLCVLREAAKTDSSAWHADLGGRGQEGAALVCKVFSPISIFSSTCSNCGHKKSHEIHSAEHHCTMCYQTFTAKSNSSMQCVVHCGEIEIVTRGAMNKKQSKQLAGLESSGLTLFQWSCCPDKREACLHVEQFRDLQVPHRGRHQ